MCYAPGNPGIWFQAVGEGDVAELESKVRGMLGISQS
jgi:hypothetical protein